MRWGRATALVGWGVSAALCLGAVGGCGGGDGEGSSGSEPPDDITADAYASHNEAADVQEQWQSSDPSFSGLCTAFFESPELVEALSERPGSLPVLELSNDYFDALSDVSQGEIEAAGACAEGTDLERWESEELDAELADREADEEELDQQALIAAADVIDELPALCESIHDELAPLTTREDLRNLGYIEDSLVMTLPDLQGDGQPIPEGADIDEIAANVAFACADFNPANAAEGLRNNE